MIQTLPTEIIEHVCDELRVHQDLLALALCCRMVYAFIAEDHLIYRRIHTGMDPDNLRLRPVWQHFVENSRHARRVSEVHLNGRSDLRDSRIVTRLVENGPGIVRIARGQQHEFFLLAMGSMSSLVSFSLDNPNHLGVARANQLWRLLAVGCPQLHRLRIMQITPEFTEDLHHIKGLRSIYVRFKILGPHTWVGTPHEKLFRFLASQSALERLSLESLPDDDGLPGDVVRNARWPKLTHLRLKMSFRTLGHYHGEAFIIAHGSALQVLECPTLRLRPLAEGSLPVLHTCILGNSTDQTLVNISHACPPSLVEIRGLSERRQIIGGVRGRTAYKREGLASVQRVYTRACEDPVTLVQKIGCVFSQDVEVFVPNKWPETGWRRFTTSEWPVTQPLDESE